MEQDIIVNKVAESGIITIDMQDFYDASNTAAVDLADFLEEGILREKIFREKLKNWDISELAGKHVALFCSEDAIIQPWAWMLMIEKLKDATVYMCSKENLATEIVKKHIETKINPADYQDLRVVIKGCGAKYISPECYTLITQKLIPVVKSLMYGEPCSTVPVYKKPKSPKN